jgi:hypothetical protein
MAKSKSKIARFGKKLSADGSKVHVYLLVPIGLYEWLETEAVTGEFKNAQDKILDVLRSTRESQQAQAA